MWWRLKVAVSSVLYQVGRNICLRFYGLPLFERAAVVVRCRKCGTAVDVVEGHYDHTTYQCLVCNVLTDDVTIQVMPYRQAEPWMRPHLLM
jgi:hypothetical protein